MKTTSIYHGFQVKVNCFNGADFLLNKGKVYKTKTAAQKAIAKLVSDIDEEKVAIDCFSYCQVEEWFA